MADPHSPLPPEDSAPTLPAATGHVAPLPGLVLGGYRLETPLGSGATAVVYRAIDVRLGREVALKILQTTTDTHVRERFLREVRVVAGLRHPNVVLLYGAGEDNGFAWAAMELLPGSLSQELLNGPLTAQAAIAVARDVSAGLEAAWARGVVHRDIKPSNLLRDADGAIKIADFGLAKDLSADLHLTAVDVILGTPLYISPEQAAGRSAGPASDLYSLGATLYHLVAGRPPFLSGSALDIIVRHAVEAPPPLPSSVPPRLAALILQLLEKDPAKRPPDFATLRRQLDDVASSPTPYNPDRLSPVDAERGDGVSASVLAAARAALQMGRGARARTLLEPLVRERAPGWIQAAFMLVATLEESGDLQSARQLLSDIAASARLADDRALAWWSLGQLAEKESAGALGRAVDAYRQITGVSTSRFPRALLDARLERLRLQIVSRSIVPGERDGEGR